MTTKTNELLHAVALSVIASLGCSQSQNLPAPASAAPAVEADRATIQNETTPQNTNAAAADEVSVQVKDFDGIQELIASKRGKVVVMDCWSTWCDPCVKEFPGLVELHKQYPPDDLACISLSFNYEGGKKEKPEDYVETVLTFLRSQKAAFDNVIASVPSEELYQKLGFKAAAIPAIFVYDREGNIARQFEGEEAKYRDVGKLVSELIEKSPAASSETREQ